MSGDGKDHRTVEPRGQRPLVETAGDRASTASIRLLSSRNSQILDRIKQHLKASTEAWLASAYVSPAGIEELLPSLRALLKRGGVFRLYATFDGSVSTRPNAFHALVDLLRKYPKQVELYLYPSGQSLFHAKVFLFKNSRNEWGGIIGSSNLTQAALRGRNFEAAAECSHLAISQIEAFQGEISRLREQGCFTPVDGERLDAILAEFGIVGNEPTSKSKQEIIERERQKQRTQKKKALDAAAPKRLSPLPPLVLGSREFVEMLCSRGMGVGVMAELEDLSVSIQLTPFISADIIRKEKRVSIGKASKRTTEGYSFSLIPNDQVRKPIASAGRSIGRLLAARSVDLGFMRWSPRQFFAPLVTEISENQDVKDAKKAAGGIQDIAEHRMRPSESILRCGAKWVSVSAEGRMS